MGKVHALLEGQRQCPPRADWLLFVDADTVHRPGGLAAGMRMAIERQVDLLSLVPTLLAGSFWERLVQPSVAALIGLFNQPARVNHPDRPEAFANGQFLLVRTRVYSRTGGHQSVSRRVLDDVELARSFKQAGARILLADGRQVFATRMYEGLRQIVNGWSKNLGLLLGGRPGRVWLAAMTALLLSWWPAVFGWLALACLLAGVGPWSDGALWTMLGVYLASLGFQVILRLQNGWFPAYAPLAPLGNLMAIFILMRAGWNQLRGTGTVWKDRRVIDRPDGEGQDG
jgi:hypothetical protein